MTETPIYVRHRDRMVQESVFEDLQNTLIACRWSAGTTTKPVVSPYAPNAGFQVVTTLPNQVLKAVAGSPVRLIDSFPEAESDTGPSVGSPSSGKVEPNTLALDDPNISDPVPLELGSPLQEVVYRFNLAFWAETVGIAQAVLNDLRDRYQGRIVSGDFIHLYDYNTDPELSVCRMEVDAFAYTRDVEDLAASFELTLFYGQLTITDVQP